MDKEQALKELEKVGGAGYIYCGENDEPEICFSADCPEGWISVEGHFTRKQLLALLVFLPES